MDENLNLLTKCYIANCNKEFKKEKHLEIHGLKILINFILIL